MKPLPPSLREKNRYVVYQVSSQERLNFLEVQRALQEAAMRFMGELGMAASGFLMLQEWKHQRGMIKVNHQYVDEVKGSFLFVQEIEGEKVKAESVGVSGILRKAKMKFMHQKEEKEEGN